MILFVAITEPVFDDGGTMVAELAREERDVEEEEVKAVEPESCEDLELWLIV